MIVLDSFKDDFNAFLKNYALYICLAVVLIIIITLVVIFVIKNRKVSKKEEPIDSNKWVEALGGKENIKEVNATASRLTLVLVNKDLIKKEELTSLGVSSSINMSNKLILVIENKAEQVKSEIDKSLN